MRNKGNGNIIFGGDVKGDFNGSNNTLIHYGPEPIYQMEKREIGLLKIGNRPFKPIWNIVLGIFTIVPGYLTMTEPNHIKSLIFVIGVSALLLGLYFSGGGSFEFGGILYRGKNGFIVKEKYFGQCPHKGCNGKLHVRYGGKEYDKQFIVQCDMYPKQHIAAFNPKNFD